MNIKELIKILDAKEINIANENTKIEKGFASDLLSYVMGNAPEKCAWFTVMNNINVCAVASLVDVTIVVLCDGIEPEKNLVDKAVLNNINIVVTDLNTFEAIKKLASCNEI